MAVKLWRRMLLASSGFKRGMLLNVLQSTGQPATAKTRWPKMSAVLRLRNSALEANNSVNNLQIIEAGAKSGKSTNPRSHSRKEQSPGAPTSPAQALFRVAGTGSERIPNSMKVQAMTIAASAPIPSRAVGWVWREHRSGVVLAVSSGFRFPAILALNLLRAYG